MFSIMVNCFTWIKRRREPIKKVTLLMVGLDNAGKTSTVADLKGDTLDGITPTVGFLTSSVALYRYNVTIYDIGGGSRIRPIWNNYFSEAYGIVFVVDASDRQRLHETRDVLHESMNSAKIYGKPILILANKQDIKGAMKEEEVYEQLDIDGFSKRNKCQCQVYSCTAILGQGNKIDRQIKKGFQWLLQEISQNYSTLSQRVERDYTEQKRIAAEERKKKLERIRREKEAREKEEQEAAERAAKQEDSDDDVVVGKNPKKKETTPPKPKKRSKKKIQVKEENSSEEYVQNETHQDTTEPSIEENRTPARGRLAPIDLEPAETDKKKKKKKKRKTNKTAPINDEMELQTKRNISAWEDSHHGSSSMNGFSGGKTKSRVSPRRLEPLSHPIITESRTINSSADEDIEEPRHLKPIRTKSWTRTRPNSEDQDIIT
ncbi:ADP-ribosylation factor-like protein 13B [Exaiptasia diaphana]|uniref:ADP-ribosylation factor-like protein 13B n=1 Tax=Exaiptasia diaphana TaxID=2652724 RepID=A0A913XVQ2_EXADI|nr:ADP-ribosylation factor-like protein 13B [Exaiptasia diaphana]KXJ24352.1 ADP-ribosylation factor-like protein 13B [Exaiptasia diaphana]